MAERRYWPAFRPLAAALGALALGGCSATHVGDDWQCPLAQGKVCTSVADADPAVPVTLVPATTAPATGRTTNLVDEAPFGRRNGAAAVSGTAGGPGCESECDPLAWLGSLFSGIAGAGSADPGTDASRQNGGVASTAASASDSATGTRATPVAGDTQDPAADVGHFAFGASGARPAALAPAVPGDAPPPAEDGAGGDGRPGDAPDPAAPGAVRTGEVVARIWIAPFVDAEGIYREGSYVRAVIAPAEWRPR